MGPEVEGKCLGARRALLNARSSCRCRRPRLLPRPSKAAMSASAVYVLDLKGKVLICRNYRGDVDMSEVEHFMPILMEKEEEGMLSPILAHGGVRFMWIKHNNLYLVATSKKNEVFLDVIEAVNLLVSANGNVLRSEIVGSIKMRVFLSGMPELRLGLNDKVLFDNTGRGKSKSVELEDVKFHQCVRLSRFENDRTISFIPPDGEFELMSYRLNTHVKPLIWIESVIEKHSHSRIEYMVKAKSQFKRRSTANNVEIHIPVPNDADSPFFKCPVQLPCCT